MVYHMDVAIGRVVESLVAAGLYNDTIIAFMSDVRTDCHDSAIAAHPFILNLLVCSVRAERRHGAPRGEQRAPQGDKRNRFRGRNSRASDAARALSGYATEHIL